MKPAAQSASRTLRWPAERFYWAVLDASILPPPLKFRPSRPPIILNAMPGLIRR